jgi:hypothetical protein
MVGGRTQERNGKTTLLVGLSSQNLEHLKSGAPLSLKAETHPFVPANMEILLFAGNTEASMLDHLESARGA